MVIITPLFIGVTVFVHASSHLKSAGNHEKKNSPHCMDHICGSHWMFKIILTG